MEYAWCTTNARKHVYSTAADCQGYFMSDLDDDSTIFYILDSAIPDCYHLHFSILFSSQDNASKFYTRIREYTVTKVSVQVPIEVTRQLRVPISGADYKHGKYGPITKNNPVTIVSTLPLSDRVKRNQSVEVPAFLCVGEKAHIVPKAVCLSRATFRHANKDEDNFLFLSPNLHSYLDGTRKKPPLINISTRGTPMQGHVEDGTSLVGVDITFFASDKDGFTLLRNVVWIDAVCDEPNLSFTTTVRVKDAKAFVRYVNYRTKLNARLQGKPIIAPVVRPLGDKQAVDDEQVLDDDIRAVVEAGQTVQVVEEEEAE